MADLSGFTAAQRTTRYNQLVQALEDFFEESGLTLETPAGTTKATLEGVVAEVLGRLDAVQFADATARNADLDHDPLKIAYQQDDDSLYIKTGASGAGSWLPFSVSFDGLGTIASKDEIAEADLASALATKINAIATGQLADAAVTNAKLANMATGTVKGRTTAGTGSPEDIALSDLPISDAMQTALDLKKNAADLAAVASSGDYGDLTGRPTLGTAAAEDAGAFATSEQGGKADSAVQPATLGAKVDPIEARRAAAESVQPVYPFLSRELWLVVADKGNGEGGGMLGVDPIVGVVDRDGPMRAQPAPVETDFSDTWGNASGEIAFGLRRDNGYLQSTYGITGPNIDRLEDRSVQREPVTSLWKAPLLDENRYAHAGFTLAGDYIWDGADETTVGVSPDVHGRPQLWAVSAQGFKQLTYDADGVLFGRAAKPCEDEDGLARYAAKRAGGGSLYASWRQSLAAGSSTGKLYGVFSYGQSLSIGFGTTSTDTTYAVTVLPPEPGQVLMFSDAEDALPTNGTISPSNFALASMPSGNADYLVDARELYRAGGAGLGETGWVAAARGYRDSILGRADKVVVSGFGVGGRTYAELKKGTTPYANFMAGVTALDARATDLSLSAAVVDWVPIEQGEANSSDAQATYAGYLDEWQSDMDTDIKAITSQTEDVWFTVSQMGQRAVHDVWDINQVALAQLERGLNADNILCCGPKYQMAFPDGIHLDSGDYLRNGGYHEKAFVETARLGVKWKPLHMTAAVISGDEILLTFHVPKGRLVFDTTTLPALTTRGITVAQSGSLLTIRRVEIVGTNQILVKLASTPVSTSGIEVGVAAIGANTAQGTATSRFSNIRDQDDWAHPHTGQLLHNWACHQIIDVTTS